MRTGWGRVAAVAVGTLLVTTACEAPAHGPAVPPGSPPASAAPAWPPAGGRGPCAVTKTADVPVPMRDGTVLLADIYRPTTEQPVPVILYRTQYNKTAAQVTPYRYQTPDWFASHCYLVLTQDIRGLYASAGEFTEFANDRDDGYDSVEWAARLPGSTGKVGMYGSSYVGATQWLAAETAPPHLTTIVPSNTASDYFDGWTYEGGAFRLNFVEPWYLADLAIASAQHRGDAAAVDQLQAAKKDQASWLRFTPYQRLPPLQPANPAVGPDFFTWLRHRTADDYWARWAPSRYYPRIAIPVLNFEGWYDAFLAGGVHNFTGMVASAGSEFARANQRLVIGPYDHTGWGRPGGPGSPMLRQFPAVASSPVNDLMLAWWDHYLKGVDNGVGTGGPRVDYFQLGSNTWHATGAWPPPGTQTTAYYLGSGGHANTGAGDGTLSPSAPAAGSAPSAASSSDSYRYDPTNPVPSLGGHSCCGVSNNYSAEGPYDQRPVEARQDVLTYSTPPVEHDTDVTGPISLTLWATSSAPDTDWTAKLVVVHPDGTAVNLNNGIVRASYRDSLSAPSPIVPGQPYRYTIDIWPTSNLFHAGDRIRLEVSSSDFPQFDPNPNTGGWLGDSTATRPAEQTVLHDAAHPSALLLPIVPAAAEPTALPAAPTH